MENRKLIAAAALCLVANAAQAADWLKDKDLHYVFAGREISGSYSNDVAFSEIYHRDGSIDYTEGTTGLKGKWRIDGEKFCTDYDGQPGGCFRVASQGTNCFEYWLLDSAGEVKERAWIARGWQSRHPSTCPPK